MEEATKASEDDPKTSLEKKKSHKLIWLVLWQLQSIIEFIHFLIHNLDTLNINLYIHSELSVVHPCMDTVLTSEYCMDTASTGSYGKTVFPGGMLFTNEYYMWGMIFTEIQDSLWHQCHVNMGTPNFGDPRSKSYIHLGTPSPDPSITWPQHNLRLDSCWQCWWRVWILLILDYKHFAMMSYFYVIGLSYFKYTLGYRNFRSNGRRIALKLWKQSL